MDIDLTAKSKELKEYVSQFETTMFLGDISALIKFIGYRPIESLENLSSPSRQLFYIAALNVSSPNDGENHLKTHYSDDEFDHIKKLLNEIEDGYNQLFYPKPGDNIDEAWVMRREIAMPSFLMYFNQGLLNYEEQIIERVIKYFTPFNDKIKEQFGLEVSDFVEIYNFIDSLPNKYLIDNVNRKDGQQTWKEFCEEMKEKEIPPWEWQ